MPRTPPPRINPTHACVIFLLAAPVLGAQSVDSVLLLNQTPPAQIAADAQGNLLVAQPISNTVQAPLGVYRYTPQGALIESFPSQTVPFSSAALLAADPQGAVYFGGGNTLLRIGDAWAPQLPSTAFNLNRIAFDPQRNPILLITDRSVPAVSYARVLKLDRTTGQQVGAFDLPTAAYPNALAVDPTGAVYVAGVANNLKGFAAKLDPTLQNQVYLTPLDAAQPNSVTVDSAGNAYVAETPLEILNIEGFGGGIISFGADAVYKLNASGAITSSNAGGGSFIAVDASGNLVVVGGSYSPTGAFQVSCGPRTALTGLSITLLDSATLQPRNSAFLAQQQFLSASTPLADGSLFVATQSDRILHASPAAPSSPVSCVANGASFLVENTIVPGQLLTIFGAGLGSDPLTAFDDSQQLPFSSGGTAVHVGGYSAPLLAVSSSQINAIVPFEISRLDPSQPAAIEIVRNGHVIYTWQMSPAAQKPSPLLTIGPSGALDFLAYHDLISSYPVPLANALNADGTLNSASNPAHLGSTVTIFATGFGQLSGGAADGVPGGAQPQAPASGGSATIVTNYGDIPASVATIAGRTNAVMQIQLTIPPSLPAAPLPFLIGPAAATIWTNFLYVAR